MNKIAFHKYQGTGNDFIITEDLHNPSTGLIQQLCDRKFGIGADGLICMKKNSERADFEMMYYNADGTASFCGNGSRCGVLYAYERGWVKEKCSFMSNDGVHLAEVSGQIVHLKMHDVEAIHLRENDFETNTGSPHYLTYSAEIAEQDIIEPARAIRYGDRYKQEGINVNFLESRGNVLHVRTYERGVEDETLSCGTGVTAAAITHHKKQGLKNGKFQQRITTLGGNLEVSFEANDDSYSNIYLSGPAVSVFDGSIELP